MKGKNQILACALSACMLALCVDVARGCTSAVVSRGISRDGRALLWKHRDSGFKDNVVERVEATDTTMAYVALFNASDSLRLEAWIGFNEAGFAVMNTASYNLAPDTAIVKDREGVVMSRALARCRTVGEFLRVLDDEMAGGSTAGVQANFGVIDASGAGAYVEASDHAYRVYPLADAPDGWMVRSNYSYSGGVDGRLGEVRHDNAVTLLRGVLDDDGGVAPENFTEDFSRSFYHAGHEADMLADRRYAMLTDRGEYIPRRSSCASVVIEGARDGENPRTATVMWVAIGFPAASVAMPVTIDSIPVPLLADPGTGRSPLCDEANRRRDRVFHRKGREGKWLIDTDYLLRLMPKLREDAMANYRTYRRPAKPIH